jgi:hypothetical protein
MKKITAGLIGAALLAVVAILAAPRATAQAASSCPPGFTLIQTTTGDPEDVNLDGLVCQNRDIRSETFVILTVVDNSGKICPPPQSGFVPIVGAPGVSPDRNCNGVICLKAFFTGNGSFHQVAIDDKGPSVPCT